jgi:sortase A
MTVLDDPPVLPVNPIERRVREMVEVRRLAGEILAGQAGDAAVLSDEEWHALCTQARGAKNEELAIARVVKAAYRHRGASAPARTGRNAMAAIAAMAAMAERTVAKEAAGLAEAQPSTRLSPEALSDLPELPIPAGFASPPPTAGGTIGSVTDPIALDPDGRSVSKRDGAANAFKASLLRWRRQPEVAPIQLDERRRELWLTIASWVRNFGLIILLFVVWQLWGTAITQHHSQNQLAKQFQAKIAQSTPAPAARFTLVPANVNIADPPEGSVMAELQIPKINLNQYVVSGTNEGDLSKGPGHYVGTAMPGQAGNVAIAGHRTTHGAPFNRLAELAVGDPIYLTTLSHQTLTYIVSATPVPVSPTDVSVLNNFGDNRITLTTCNPEFSARQRLIVVAAYVPPGAARPAPVKHDAGKPYKLTAVVSSGWNMSELPLVLAAVGLLTILGVFSRKLSKVYGRVGRWLVLVPIWTALLLVLFEGLTNFLPASV